MSVLGQLVALRGEVVRVTAAALKMRDALRSAARPQIAGPDYYHRDFDVRSAGSRTIGGPPFADISWDSVRERMRKKRMTDFRGLYGVRDRYMNREDKYYPGYYKKAAAVDKMLYPDLPWAKPAGGGAARGPMKETEEAAKKAGTRSSRHWYDYFTGGLTNLFKPASMIRIARGITFGGGNAALVVLGGLVARFAYTVSHAATETLRLSRALGIGTESLIAFRDAGKELSIASEDVDKALGRLNTRLGEVQFGSIEAAQAFETIGLNGRELAAMPLDDAMTRVITNLSEIEDPMLRVGAAVRIGGDEFARIIALLSGGGATIEQAAVRARELGISFGQIQATQVENMHLAMSRLGDVLRGVILQVLIQISPYVEALATGFTDWARSGGNAGVAIVSAIKFIAIGIAKLMDGVGGLSESWAWMKVAALIVFDTILSYLEFVTMALDRWFNIFIDAFNWLADLVGMPNIPRIPWFDDMNASIANWRAHIGEAIAEAGMELMLLGNAANAEQGVRNFFAGIEEGARRAAAAANALRANGAAAAARFAEIFAAARGVVNQNLTHWQKFSQTILNITFYVRKLAMTIEEFGMAAANAFAQLEKAYGLADIKSPELVLGGTQASVAREAQYANEMALGRESIQDRMARILAQSAEIHRQQLRVAEQIREILGVRRPEPIRLLGGAPPR